MPIYRLCFSMPSALGLAGFFVAPCPKLGGGVAWSKCKYGSSYGGLGPKCSKLGTTTIAASSLEKTGRKQATNQKATHRTASLLFQQPLKRVCFLSISKLGGLHARATDCNILGSQDPIRVPFGKPSSQRTDRNKIPDRPGA